MKRMTRKERKRRHSHDFRYVLMQNYKRGKVVGRLIGCDCGAMMGDIELTDEKKKEAKEILDKFRF